jgi:hypothetical protein
VQAPATLLFLLFLLFATQIVALARSINRRNSKNSKRGFGLYRPNHHLGRVTQLSRNAAPISAFDSV